MAITKGIKQFLKTVKSKEVKKRNKNKLLDQQDLSKLAKPIPASTNQMKKNISPSLAGALGISVGVSAIPPKEMKTGGVVSSKSKSSGIALKGFGKEIK
jgi:hypothetical protein